MVTAVIKIAPLALMIVWAAAAGAAEPGSSPGQLDESASLELRKKSQNPVGKLISLPFQNNFNPGYGAKDAPHSSSTQYVLNIQLVIPITLGDTGFNLITRPIVPIIRQPDLVDGGETWGVGDIQIQSYLSPQSDEVIFGAGPILQPPTATNGRKLGTQKWSAGGGLAVGALPGRWVLGLLVTQIWSFAGDSDRENVSYGTAQPFLNYNFEKGWYLSTSPIITANWEAHGSDNKFTVPVGGGVGRLVRIGRLPVDFLAGVYYNAVKPEDDPTADWNLRLQVKFLFPK